MIELLARLNPELLRGWRAECTLLRLAVTVLLCAGVAWCVQLGWDWRALGRVGLIAVGVLSYVVTPVRVVGAIADEHNRHTWQRQRMSALSPTQMMLGKAFGATALTDLAALCALACWALGVHLAVAEGIGESALAQVAADMERNRASFPLEAWLMVCANLLARFLALALAIRNCDRSKAARGRSFVVAILLTALLIGPLEIIRSIMDSESVGVLWLGFASMDSDSFWAISGLALVTFTACWGWCAARETLSGGRFPFEAIIVGLGVGLWWVGTFYGLSDARLSDADGRGNAVGVVGYGSGQMATATLLLALVAVAYLWGVAERVDRRRAREFLAAPSLRRAPAWLVIALLAAAAAVLHLIFGLFADRGEQVFFQVNFWVVSLLGFVVRDLGILFLVLTGKVKRWPELAALASWLVLGLFVPGALSGVDASVGGLELYRLFAPIVEQWTAANLIVALVSAWLQAGLVVMWLVKRGRSDGRKNDDIGNT